MKKFLFEILIFAVVGILLFSLIVNINISDRYIIEKTRGTGYEKIAWNLNLINEHPEKIQGALIFFGSSIIEAGICDSTFQSKGIKAINLGVNHTGKEMELYFLNKIVKYNPKKIYLSANKMSITLHQMTPLLYTPGSLLKSGQSFNASFINFCINRITFVLDYLRWYCQDKVSVQINYPNYGVVYEKGHLTNDAYSSMKENYHVEIPKPPSTFQVYWRKLVVFYFNAILNGNSQCNFLLRAKQIASNYHVKIAGLYTPISSDAMGKHNNLTPFPAGMIEIEKLNTFSFLDQASYWFDASHLSKEGAIKYTNELISSGKITE